MKCEFEDCFACDGTKCTLLKTSYKEDEICPFYKPINKDDVLNDTLTATYNYTIRRIGELKEEIEKAEQAIKELEYATALTIKHIRKDIGAKRIALRTVEKEKDRATKAIEEKEKSEQ